MSASADQWIFLDIAQLRRKNWMTRNRLRNANNIFWFGPRIAHEGKRLDLKDARILSGLEYAKRLRSSMSWYKANTPHGSEVSNLVCQVLSSWEGLSLLQLNTLSTQAFFDWVGVDIGTQVASEVPGFPLNSSRGLWALEAAKVLGSRRVVNPEAGIEFFDVDAYRASGVSLLSYSCDPIDISAAPKAALGNGLSWLDTASWLSRDELKGELARLSRIREIA